MLDLLRSRCRPGTAATPVNLVVVSALAEGADRMGGREAMARGAGLEVVLPLPSEDYLTDFESGTSRSQFCGLLGQASAVTELAASGTRDQAYERVAGPSSIGPTCCSRSGMARPHEAGGGTAEIVSYARRRGVPVVQLPVERIGRGSPQPRTMHESCAAQVFPLLSDEAFGQLDRLDSALLRPRAGSAPLLPEHTAVPARVRSFIKYAQPYFDRADPEARSTQRLFIWLTRLLYALAAVAVVVVATQIIFFFHDPKIVWAEFAALLTVVLTLVFGRRGHWHDRWLAARSLAERIRSGVFLAAVGGGNDLRRAASPRPADRGLAGRRPAAGRARRRRAQTLGSSSLGRLQVRCQAHLGRHIARRRSPARARGGRGVSAGFGELDPNQEWVERAFREIYWGGPEVPPASPSFPSCATCW